MKYVTESHRARMGCSRMTGRWRGRDDCVQTLTRPHMTSGSTLMIRALTSGGGSKRDIHAARPDST